MTDNDLSSGPAVTPEKPMPDTIESLRAEKHQAYAERNQLVAALSKIWPSHWCQHPEDDTTWDDEWRTIICIHSPVGQLTWHIKLSEQSLFSHLPKGASHWDGHTTAEKYARLASLTNGVAPEAPHDAAQLNELLENISEFLSHCEWNDRSSETQAGDLLERIREYGRKVEALAARAATSPQQYHREEEAPHDAATDWLPIETAPKDGTIIIGALIRDGKLWRVHDMRHNGLAFYTINGGSLPRMTHWIQLPAARAATSRVIEAARCIRHWHDALNGDGMIVSASHVRALWDALGEYDEAAAPVLPPHAYALRVMLKAIPQANEYHANRYDTDDEHVLTVWDEGHSFDIRLPKSKVDDRTPMPFSSLEKLLLALDARLDKEPLSPDAKLREGIGNALKAENLRILTEAIEPAPVLPPHDERPPCCEGKPESYMCGCGCHRYHAQPPAATVLPPQPARMFPIQGGPDIPWDVIAPFDKQCQRNHGGQTLERLAERGGLGVSEAIAVLLAKDYDEVWGNRYDKANKADYTIELLALVRQRQEQLAAPVLPQESDRLQKLGIDVADALTCFIRWEKTCEVALDPDTTSAMHDLMATWKSYREEVRAAALRSASPVPDSEK